MSEKMVEIIRTFETGEDEDYEIHVVIWRESEIGRITKKSHNSQVVIEHSSSIAPMAKGFLYTYADMIS